MFKITSCLVVFIFLFLKVNCSMESSDPRKNTSLYDVIVTGNIKNQNSIIANCNEILHKKASNKSISIFKYKLIYYSPQPLQIFSNKLDNSNNITSIKLDPLFSIDVNNGSLYMKTPDEPLLEYLCIKKAYCSCFSCIFTLNIIYSTSNKINADTIRVFIDDSNDYPPVFFNKKNNDIVISISEQSKIGDVFKLINSTAIDSDAFYNKISYFLSTESGLLKQTNLFEVSITNESTFELNLILKTNLDFEICQKYEFYLIARDNGKAEMLQSSKRLVINILDENDHKPICENSLFIASVNENMIEKNILRIVASDADQGLNSKLEYFLIDDQKIQDLFEIEKSSGWISLKLPLDYEKKSFYDFKIKGNFEFI
jgi:hypothetical protein